MKAKPFAVTAAFAFALIFATIGRTEEKSKDKEKAPASTEPTYSVTCPGPCDFKVSGHDKAEVTAVVKAHAKSHHKADMADKDIEAMMKTKEPKK
jgi:predicted small metal-binding protein